MKDVGIVMPVYNQVPHYLRIAIRTILNQSYPHFSLVVVIDGASEETTTIVEKEVKDDKRVHIIYKKKNEGVSKGLNTGFDHLLKFPNIKYLTWVSSDNIYYKDFLEKLRKALHHGPPSLGLAYSSFRHIDGDGNLVKNHPKLEDFRKFQNQPKEKLLDVCLIGTSFMYKRYYAEQLDKGYHMEPVEDYEYWLRLAEICGVTYVPIELMDYRVNSPESISTQLRNSLAKHRYWRYKFNLARQEARHRRGIPHEVTVIYPVTSASQEVVKKIESIYEQTFHNYKVLVLDLSPQSNASDVLSSIQDIRTKYVTLPNTTHKDAIEIGARQANTPYAIVLGESPFPTSVYALKKLLQTYKAQDKASPLISAIDTPHGQIYKRILSKNEPLDGQLYKTTTLINILASK